MIDSSDWAMDSTMPCWISDHLHPRARETAAAAMQPSSIGIWGVISQRRTARKIIMPKQNSVISASVRRSSLCFLILYLMAPSIRRGDIRRICHTTCNIVNKIAAETAPQKRRFALPVR